MLSNSWLATIITFILALAWLRLNDFFAVRGWISSNLSRKIIHMGTGPIFVLCWLLYPEDLLSRYLAALVPLAITIQFFLVGIGLIKDKAAVEAMSRTGERREILRGPLFYGIIFVVLTVIYWKDSPIGIVALMLLCGGDGLADVLGSRMQSGSLPWSSRKTIIGTASMFFGGLIFTMVIIGVYISFNVFPGDLIRYLLPVTIISIIGTAVESLPLADLDNLTVPAVAVIMGHILF